MPTFDEVRPLLSRSRLLVQQERAYLRRLQDELAETQCVTAFFHVDQRTDSNVRLIYDLVGDGCCLE